MEKDTKKDNSSRERDIISFLSDSIQDLRVEIRQQTESVNQKMDKQTELFDKKMDKQTELFDKKMDRQTELFDKKMDRQKEDFDEKIAGMTAVFTKLTDRVDANFRWVMRAHFTLIGMVITAMVAVGALIISLNAKNTDHMIKLYTRLETVAQKVDFLSENFNQRQKELGLVRKIPKKALTESDNKTAQLNR